MKRGCFLFIVSLTVIGACNVPRDTGSTLSNIIEGDTLKAGLVVRGDVDTCSLCQVEKEYLLAIAEALGTGISFVSGGGEELVKQLEDHRLHIVAGGFTRRSVFKKKTAFTAAFDDKHRFAIPKGENGWLFLADSIILAKKHRH